ncbi:alpha-amylase family glycosyl hydrolase [soil metagenome]
MSEPGSPAADRRRLLDQLYGPKRSGALTSQVEALLAAERPRRRSAGWWDQRDLWVIAYPDQFITSGEAPLATLARFHARHLAPWVNGLHVLPFVTWSSDDGFAVTDYESVDERYGTWEDIERLAAQVRLMADLVLNHLSSESLWFAGFLAGDPQFAGFFRTTDPYADLSLTVRPRTSDLLTRFDSAGGAKWVWTTFSADQVDLDYRNPAVLVRVLKVLLAYVRHGIDVIRLDAVAFLWKQEGTPSIHLPATHAVIQFLRRCLDEVAPDVVLVTETHVPHHENIAYFGTPSGREAHAVYQFALPPLVLDAFTSGDATTLAQWARSLRFDGTDTTFMNFLASHDGVGMRAAEGLLSETAISALGDLAQRAGGGVGWRTAQGGERTLYELNSTWFDLMAAGHDEHDAVRRHLAAHAIMLAMRGIPLLYVHSLFASDNDLALVQHTGRQRSVNRARFDDVGALEAKLESRASREAKVFEGISCMARWRAGCPAFHPDSPQRVLDTVPAIFAVERGQPDGKRARVYVNVSGQAAEASTGRQRLTLPPWSSAWCLPSHTDPLVLQ